MKKLTVLILALAVLTSLTACKVKETQPDQTTTQPTATDAPGEKPQSALQIMEKTWSLFSDEEKFFAAGGDGENAVNDGPGSFGVDNAEGLTFQLMIPEEQIANIQEAASLMHAMNTNTFTGAAFRLKDAGKAESFASAVRNAVQNNQWMCGYPDRLLIARISDEYVVSAFGKEPMTTFEAKLKQAYPNAKILYNEAVG